MIQGHIASLLQSCLHERTVYMECAHVCTLYAIIYLYMAPQTSQERLPRHGHAYRSQQYISEQ